MDCLSSHMFSNSIVMIQGCPVMFGNDSSSCLEVVLEGEGVGYG